VDPTVGPAQAGGGFVAATWIGSESLSGDRQPRAGPTVWPYYGASLAITLLFALVSAYVVWQVRATDYASGGRAAANTAKLVADDFENSFVQLDGLLKSIGRLYVDGTASGAKEPSRLADYMKNEIADYPWVSRVFVFNPDGQAVLSSGVLQLDPSAVNVADRTYFRRAAAGDKALIFDGPVEGRFANEWVIILARRLEDRQGGFLGVVGVSVPVAYYATRLPAVDLVDHGVIVLRNQEGVQIARFSGDPGERGAPGDSSISATLKVLMRGPLDHAFYRAVSPLDHVDRLYAYERLSHAPFFVLVGLPMQSLDASWRRLAMELGLLTLALAIAATWFARRLHASAVLLDEDKRLLEKRVAIRTEELETKNRALIASERKFSDMMACAPSAIAIFTADGRIVEVNAAACDLLGYTRDELLALDVASVLDPGEPRDPTNNMRRLAAGELKTYGVVRRCLRKDGRSVPVQVETSVARTSSGDVRYFIAQGYDVSSRLAYEERLRALLDSAVDGVYIHDLDGVIVEFSESFAEMLGYSRDEIRTLNVADIDVVKSASELRAAFRREAQSGRALAIETRHRRKDGSVLDVEISVKAVELGGKTYLYTSSRDIGERVRMRKMLDEERRRLRDFSRSTADWFWELDENLKFSYLSESFKGIDGLSADDLLGMSITDVYAQDALNPGALKAEGVERLRARKAFRDIERCYRDDQGEVQWFSASGVPVFDEGGAFTGYRGVAAIVTARKRAELDLERNRRLLQELVDSAAYGIGVFDENRECVVRNENYGRILGLPQDLLDRGPLRLPDQFRFCYDRGDFADLGPDLTADEVWSAVQTRGARQAERRLGNGRWVETRVAPVTGGALVTYFDVTNYKTIESELRQTKERLEAAAAAGIIGVWAIDTATGAMYWDKVQRQLYDFPEKDFEVTTRAFYARIHPEDEPSVREALRQAVLGERNAPAEFRIRRPDGSIRYFRGLSQTIRRPDGKPERVVGVTYDVTEQKTALNALEQARAQAESANRAKSEFLANISHEIRTPLNAILGMTQLLARSELGEEQTGYVRALDAAGHNMLILLTDVLDLSKIEAGQLELNEAPFSLGEVIASVTNTFAVAARTRGLALRVDPLPDDIPVLLGDATRLGQVFNNLVGNALKFTAQGGVTVSAETVADLAESVRVRVTVRDTGIGIAPRHLGKLFEPFVQAERTTYSKFGGTGLGLAISRRLITLMGGEIGVASEPGSGSEFWFVVTLRKAPAESAKAVAPRSAKGEKRLSGMRLLVVDDTDTNREIAVKLLAVEGAICEAAENGREAIERLRADPDAFDLILMDIQMPDMDGLEATRVIRLDLGLADLPVIALTAGALASQRELALAAGMNGFVAKPFRLRDLVAAIAPWLGREAAGRKASSAS